MKPAEPHKVAVRLDLLEQKLAAFSPPDDGGELRDLVERIFDRVLGWSYVGPNEEEAVTSPPSSNVTFYDTLPAYNNYSMQRAVFGSSPEGGFSAATTFSCEVKSFFEATFDGTPMLAADAAAEITATYGGLAGYCHALEGEVDSLKSRVSSLESRLAAAGIP